MPKESTSRRSTKMDEDTVMEENTMMPRADDLSASASLEEDHEVDGEDEALPERNTDTKSAATTSNTSHIGKEALKNVVEGDNKGKWNSIKSALEEDPDSQANVLDKLARQVAELTQRLEQKDEEVEKLGRRLQIASSTSSHAGGFGQLPQRDWKVVCRDDIIYFLNVSGTTTLQLPQATLNGEDLGYLDLTGSNFRAASLCRAHFFATVLNGAQLAFCDLTDSALSYAKLRKCSLYRAKLKNANLSHCHLQEASLQAADLTEASLASANLTKANLASAVFAGANLERARLYEIQATSTDFSNANMRDADMRGAKMMGTDCRSANFCDADLSFCDLSNAKLQNANLSGAKLWRARLVDSSGKRADFSGANLSGCDLTGVIAHAQITAANGEVKMIKAIFDGANLNGATGLKELNARSE